LHGNIGGLEKRGVSRGLTIEKEKRKKEVRSREGTLKTFA
jgi:hypothetical protein